jgi:hypothetical protein
MSSNGSRSGNIYIASDIMNQVSCARNVHPVEPSYATFECIKEFDVGTYRVLKRARAHC